MLGSPLRSKIAPRTPGSFAGNPPQPKSTGWGRVSQGDTQLLLYSFRKGKALRIIPTILLLAVAAPLSSAPKILVVTAGSADYIRAAGGTLASFIQQGYTVD